MVAVAAEVLVVVEVTQAVAVVAKAPGAAAAGILVEVGVAVAEDPAAAEAGTRVEAVAGVAEVPAVGAVILVAVVAAVVAVAGVLAAAAVIPAVVAAVEVPVVVDRAEARAGGLGEAAAAATGNILVLAGASAPAGTSLRIHLLLKPWNFRYILPAERSAV